MSEPEKVLPPAQKVPPPAVLATLEPDRALARVLAMFGVLS